MATRLESETAGWKHKDITVANGVSEGVSQWPGLNRDHRLETVDLQLARAPRFRLSVEWMKQFSALLASESKDKFRRRSASAGLSSLPLGPYPTRPHQATPAGDALDSVMGSFSMEKRLA
jgi:hypothetical protein